MNKMANRRCVARKLHIWVPPQLEARFWALKDLEWSFRRMKKGKKEPCHTRMFYRDGTIWAQWRPSFDVEYEDIQEPETAMIPGVEYWRNTPPLRTLMSSLMRGFSKLWIPLRRRNLWILFCNPLRRRNLRILVYGPSKIEEMSFIMIFNCLNDLMSYDIICM